MIPTARDTFNADADLIAPPVRGHILGCRHYTLLWTSLDSFVSYTLHTYPDGALMDILIDQMEGWQSANLGITAAVGEHHILLCTSD